MGYFDALLLAVLQGLTGFLPVSSSGHLVLAQYFFSSSGEIDLLYNVVLHVATGVALLIYFRHDLIALWTGLMRPSQASKSVFSGYEKQTLGYIVLALMPTAVVGLFIDTVLISLLTRPDVVGCMLVITGALLWWGRGRQRQHRTAPMRSTDALVIGLLQGLAVTPGISRSGATITGGILLGLDREFATRFSLLISVPATFGATILEVSKLEAHALPPFGPYVGYDHCRLGGIRSHRPYPASCPTRSVLSLRMVSVAARQPTERRVLHIFGGFGSKSRSLRSKSGGQTATPQSV